MLFRSGVFLTRGDNRNYGKGSFGSVKPKSGLDAGGIGAIELVVRYDRLDLNGGSVNGGTEDSGYVGVSWWPVEHLRFMLNYGHLEFRNVLVTANGDRDFGADTFAARAQIDF